MSKEVKVKVYGDLRPDVLQVLDEIRSLYAPNVTQSDVKRSTPYGYHGFITIYLEEEK